VKTPTGDGPPSLDLPSSPSCSPRSSSSSANPYDGCQPPETCRRHAGGILEACRPKAYDRPRAGHFLTSLAGGRPLRPVVAAEPPATKPPPVRPPPPDLPGSHPRASSVARYAHSGYTLLPFSHPSGIWRHPIRFSGLKSA
jgi:hypothetical protein